jgi:hypothetical protein
MALTPLQRDVCRLLAEHRKLSGEAYVAGGLALNEVLGGGRVSRDVDVFHDTETALQTSWATDLTLLRSNGFVVEPRRERPSFIEAVIRRGPESVIFEWSHDSAYRFFPLVEHAAFGLTLHPIDLATNKVLALVGRREPRDFVDALRCVDTVQPLGLLAWAACGKDPGWNPVALVDEAVKTARYSQVELDTLDWEDDVRPDARELGERWHRAVAAARALIPSLPPEEAGTCVMDGEVPARFESVAEVAAARTRGAVSFRRGSIRGAFPQAR